MVFGKSVYQAYVINRSLKGPQEHVAIIRGKSIGNSEVPGAMNK